MAKLDWHWTLMRYKKLLLCDSQYEFPNNSLKRPLKRILQNKMFCSTIKTAKAWFTFLYSVNHPQGCWNVLESERPLHIWCHIGWRNTKIYIHGASWMEWKCGKCWKSPIFEGKLWVSEMSEWNDKSKFCNCSLF